MEEENMEEEKTTPDLPYGPRAILHCSLCERFHSPSFNLCERFVLAGMSYRAFMEMLNEEEYWEAEVIRSFIILTRHKHCHLGGIFDSASKTYYETRQEKEEFDFSKEMILPEQYDHVIMICHTVTSKMRGHYALVEFFLQKKLIKIDESAADIESKSYAPVLMKILQSYGWCKGKPSLKFPSLPTRGAKTSKPYAGWRVERAISETSTTLDQNDNLPDCGPIACTNFLNRIIPNFNGWPDKSPKAIRWSVLKHFFEIQKEVSKHSLFGLTHHEEGEQLLFDELFLEIEDSHRSIDESIDELKLESDTSLLTSVASMPKEEAQQGGKTDPKNSLEKGKESNLDEKLMGDIQHSITSIGENLDDRKPAADTALETSVASMPQEEAQEVEKTYLKDSFEIDDGNKTVVSSPPDARMRTQESNPIDTHTDTSQQKSTSGQIEVSTEQDTETGDYVPKRRTLPTDPRKRIEQLHKEYIQNKFSVSYKDNKDKTILPSDDKKAEAKLSTPDEATPRESAAIREFVEESFRATASPIPKKPSPLYDHVDISPAAHFEEQSTKAIEEVMGRAYPSPLLHFPRSSTLTAVDRSSSEIQEASAVVPEESEATSTSQAVKPATKKRAKRRLELDNIPEAVITERLRQRPKSVEPVVKKKKIHSTFSRR